VLRSFNVRTGETPILKQVRQAALPIVRAMSLSAGVAHAASLPSHHIPTLDAARTVVAAAEVKAKAGRWNCVISVDDSDGLPISWIAWMPRPSWPVLSLRQAKPTWLDKLCRSIRRSRLERMDVDVALAAAPSTWNQVEAGDLKCCQRADNQCDAALVCRAGGKCSSRTGRRRGLVRCAVSDDGSRPTHIQPGRGSRIMEELTKALDGRFEQKFGPGGSTSTLIFPYRDASTRRSMDERTRFSAQCKSAFAGAHTIRPNLQFK
jgi:hypothetical protein